MLQRTHTIRLIDEPMPLSESNEGEQLVRGKHPPPRPRASERGSQAQRHRHLRFGANSLWRPADSHIRYKAFYPYQDARSVLHACEPPLETRFPGTRFTAWSQGADWNRIGCAQGISTLFRKVFPTPPEDNTERRLNQTPQSLPRRNASPSTENPQTAHSLRERRRTGHFHRGQDATNSAPDAIRTHDTRFRRAVLYPLSYRGVLT